MHYIQYHSPRRQKRVGDLGCHSDWVGSADHTENGPRGKTVLLPYETVWPIILSLQFPSPHAFATYTQYLPGSFSFDLYTINIISLVPINFSFFASYSPPLLALPPPRSSYSSHHFPVRLLSLSAASAVSTVSTVSVSSFIHDTSDRPTLIGSKI